MSRLQSVRQLKKRTMNIIEHAESFLGKISHGWKEKNSSNTLQVVSFRDKPFESIDTFLTVGLSHHELMISDTKKVRHELILPLARIDLSNTIVSLLIFISELILKNHFALLRGQVIRLRQDVAENLGFEAVYCAIPVFLDDAFASFDGSQPSTVIVWTLPIYKSEADYIDKNGWSKFEDLLEEKDPDLFSLDREPIV
jgi:hypothetical protein